MRSRRFLIGGAIIAAALVYLIYGGMRQAMVYFVTPSELKAQESGSAGKFLRVGGMVVKGSLHRNADGLTYRFQLTDGSAVIPVYFHGVPPDLFADGKGAVVEGKIGPDGLFIASTTRRGVQPRRARQALLAQGLRPRGGGKEVVTHSTMLGVTAGGIEP